MSGGRTYGDDNLTMEQVAELPADEQREYIADLSPQERGAYYYQAERAEAGGNGSFMAKLIALFGGPAGEQSREIAEENIRNLTSGDTEYVSGLDPSDADYQGHDHEQLYGYVQENLSPDQVARISNAYHGLHEAFDNFATNINDGVQKSEGEWEGGAAEQARGFFESLGTWADGNSQNAKLASEVVYQQSEAAQTAKYNMPEPVEFNWDDEFTKWQESGSTSFNSDLWETLEKRRDSSDAHDQAVEVMTQYDDDLYQAASKQPVFAEPPKFGGDVVTMTAELNSAIISNNGDGNTDSSGTGGLPPGLPPNPNPGPFPPGPSSAPDPGPSPVPPVPPVPALPGKGSGTSPGGETTAAAFRPPAFDRPASTGPWGARQAGPGAMPAGGMGGFGGGFSDYQGKSGRGGFGPGGSGAASGAAKPAGLGPAEAVAGRAGPGKAAGAAAGGGMAPGRGGGKGEEDQEHARPTFLIEADPDEIFGTNQRTAPPVIGE